MATPAAAQGEAPQAGADAISPDGQNPACPESLASEAPTTQSGGESSECTDAVAPESPTDNVGRCLAVWKGMTWPERREAAIAMLNDEDAFDLFEEEMGRLRPKCRARKRRSNLLTGFPG
jgi:hypothetical protein